MGLAQMLLGEQNPFSQFVAGNRNAIRGAGMGLAMGPDFGSGLANAALYANQGATQDDAYATAQKAEKERLAQLQKSIDYLQSSNPDMAALVAAGMDPNDAFREILTRMRPTEPTALDIREVGGDVMGFDPYSGAGRTLYDGPEAPAGDSYTLGPGQVRYGADNQVVAEGPKRAPGGLSVTAQKELFEAEDAATAGDYVLSALDEAISLNDKAYDGPTADIRGEGAALFGSEEGVATSRFKNLTTELALSQLKTIFGAMPTEGERKILLELQGSVNQPRAVRDAILKRAKVMAIRRIEDNKKKAAALRSGAYFEEGYGMPESGSGDGWTVLGVE